VKVVIAGAGGHGKVVCDALLSTSAAEIVGFVDDDLALTGATVMGFPVLASLETLNLDRSIKVAFGIGDNVARRRTFERVLALGYEPFTVVHSRAVIGRGCVIGRGVVAFAHVVVNADSIIGDDVILNTACSVDHDCRVGAHAHVAPGARLGGGVRVGEEALVGIGSAVAPNISIGARSVVGAGGVVIRNVGSGCVAVGVPARIIRRQPAEPRG
jgi:sugar O-acyltransferase (sialic acid O-acetyltransferase NeuD family)